MGQGPSNRVTAPFLFYPAGPRFRNAALHHATFLMGTLRRHGPSRDHRCDRSHQHQRSDAPELADRLALTHPGLPVL
jgi:hypothetical protein